MKAKRGLTVVFLVVAFVGCRAQNERSRQLRVFNWGDYIGENTIAGFESSTGSRIVYDNYSSNEELIAKLEAGGTSYDVVFPSGYAVEILISKRLLGDLKHASLSNLKYMMAEFRAPDADPDFRHCVPYTWSTTGIGVNREILNGTDVSWEILFDPKLKGRILMLDDVRASMGMALKSLGYSANSRSQSEIAQAKARLIQQKSLVHVYASSNLPQLIASEEVDVAYGWSGDILQAAQRNRKIQYLVPDGGSLIYVDYMCIPSSSQNKELAAQFINYVLDPEVSLDIAETIRYPTTNSAARDRARGGTRELWAVLDKAGANPAKFESIRNVGEALELYDKAWQEVKAAR